MGLFTTTTPLTEGLPFLSWACLVLTLCALGYVFYQRVLHPLAGYPGPFLASLTDLWQVYQYSTLQQPYHLTELHAKYGQFVRYGPDKLSITAEDAIPVIYQKASKSMPKTEFYDAFGSNRPNIFGTRDEAVHAVRRRQMSSSFSISYVRKMEDLLDHNIQILKNKLSELCDKNDAFDLRKLIQYYVIDVLGELAFSQSFGIQVAEDESLVPPVKETTLLGSLIGAWPLMTMRLKRWLPRVPLERLQRLSRSQAACARLASQRVERRLAELEPRLREDSKDDVVAAGERRDLLTNLILAKHPDTGERLRQEDLQTEAFGFIIAGTHTTSATASLLFYHLLHAPEELRKCVAELDENPPSSFDDRPAYSAAEVEASLPFLRTCIRENFRITPVFTMPLARRVTDPAGITIAGRHIPQGTSVAVCNHAFHHNPEVWGVDHDVFAPSRWDDPALAERARYLMHFGLGGRQCLGKTVAQANIYKLSSTLLREFEFRLADESERVGADKGVFRGRLPGLVSVGISDLDEPLMVTVKRRLKKESFKA